ncbi:MAG: Arm DNA-binding domain-containing protein, partial [Rudaea sp.]
MHAIGGVAGLLLQVAKGGSRSWVLRVRVGTKRRDIGLGGYPDVTLAQARVGARKARAEIREGVDVVAEREAARRALIAEQGKLMTFADAARAKHAAIAAQFRSAKHRQDWIRSLELYVFPVVGEVDVADIGMPHVLRVLRPIWESKTETATRVRQRMEAVLG